MLRVQELSELHRGAKLSPAAFVERWTLDALLAEGARAGALQSSLLDQVERSVLAHTLLTSLFERAKDEGEPTLHELESAAREHWFEVDRPEAAQTTHFVVLERPGQDGRGAEALARALAEAVHGLRNPEQFKQAVAKFPKHQLQVAVESLPPVARDGRSLQVDGTGKIVGAGPTFDGVFARAANLLELPGDQSGLVHTPFGFHVILLERKIPPFKATVTELKGRYASEINMRRAREAEEEILRESRRTTAVEIKTSFQESIAHLQVAQ